jgi:hypothetical protein
MVEIVGRGSCGRFATRLATLRAVTGAGETAALVDQGSQLDPQAATEIGVELEHLLWLRPQRLGDSLAAAELLVHTGFPLVALDLGLPPVRGRAPLAAWLRLARAASSQQAVVLVGSPYRLSGCAAGVVVTAAHGRGDWSRRGTSPLLGGLRARLHLSKRIGHSDRGDAVHVLTLPEAAFTNSEFGIRNSEPTVGSDLRPTAGLDGWSGASHRPLAGDGASPRPSGREQFPTTLPQDSAPSEIEEKGRKRNVATV